MNILLQKKSKLKLNIIYTDFVFVNECNWADSGQEVYYWQIAMRSIKLTILLIFWPYNIMPAKIFQRFVADRTLAIYNPKPKKQNGYTGILLISLLIVSIMVGLGSSALAYNNAQQGQTQILTECQNLITEARQQGFELNSSGCDNKPAGLNVFNNNLELSLANLRRSFQSQQSRVNLNLAFTEQQITNLERTLTQMATELPVWTSNPSWNNNQKIQERQQYLAKLQELDTQSQTKINATVSKFQNLLDLGVGLSLNSYINYLANYTLLTPVDQRIEFTKLQAQLTKLETEIPAQIIVLGQIDSTRADRIQARFFKNLTGDDFKNLYNSTVYNSVEPPIDSVTILGNLAADNRIIGIAEQRGYIKRSQAIEKNLIAADSQQLQPEASQAWINLKNKANKEGINLVMVSGYRSVNQQRGIFLARFGNSFTPDQISTGAVDLDINTLLETTSIPGYSRHHTGYTFDIGCDSTELVTFGKTKCYDWISANNYLNAKIFGLIPSYPKETEGQGPNPEAWEYVWVGDRELKI